MKVKDLSSKCLKLLIEFLEKHDFSKELDIPEPLYSPTLEGLVDPWDLEFVTNIEVDDLFETLKGAEHLNIDDFVKLGCAQLATLVKGKSPEELRKIFNIENDFTEEEQKAITTGTAWLQEED